MKRIPVKRIPCAVAALLLAAGCHNSPTPAPRPARASASAPSPTITPLPAAADGAKLSACHDGRCEVLVSEHDVIHPPARFGMAKLTIEKIGKDGLTVVGTSPGAMVSFSGQQPGRTSTLNGLKVTTVALQGTKAVIRLAPGH